MTLAAINKYQLFETNIKNVNSFITIQHFNLYTNDIKKLRLFCALNNITLSKYKNTFIKNKLNTNDLKNIFINTFYIAFFDKCNTNILNLELIKKFITFIHVNKLNLLITYIAIKNNINLTTTQFNLFFDQLKTFNSIKLFLFFKVKLLKTFIKFDYYCNKQ